MTKREQVRQEREKEGRSVGGRLGALSGRLLRLLVNGAPCCGAFTAQTRAKGILQVAMGVSSSLSDEGKELRSSRCPPSTLISLNRALARPCPGACSICTFALPLPSASKPPANMSPSRSIIVCALVLLASCLVRAPLAAVATRIGACGGLAGACGGACGGAGVASHRRRMPASGACAPLHPQRRPTRAHQRDLEAIQGLGGGVQAGWGGWGWGGR